jgi:Arc/MetJ family transcription regulator
MHKNLRLLRTNIEIDDRLMRQAMRGRGAPTKRAVVEEGLRLLIQTKASQYPPFAR